MMDTKDRIKQVMEAQHMTQQVFAQFIEVSPASLSSIFNGRTKPTLNILESIKLKIPNINTDWLMFGFGDMFVAEKTPVEGDLFSQEYAGGQTLDFGLENPMPSSTDNNGANNQRLATQKNNGVANTHSEIVREEIKYIDKPQRKITEIRVYFDDLTYETFVPSKK